MGLIQDFIDSKSEPTEVAERSIKKDKKKKTSKLKISRTGRSIREGAEKGGRKVVRAGERISRARLKFRKGRISKGLRVTI